MKLSDEDKLEIIRLNKEEGIPKKRLAEMYGIGLAPMKELFARYNLHGVEALIKKPYRTFSPEFKLEVIDRHREGESINSLAVINDIHRAMIYSWIRRYEKDGYNGLADKKKGRPPKMKKNDDATSKMISEAADDEVKADSADMARIKLLEKRNRELEAEIAYLKKLNALVQERKKRESKKK